MGILIEYTQSHILSTEGGLYFVALGNHNLIITPFGHLGGSHGLGFRVYKYHLSYPKP